MTSMEQWSSDNGPAHVDGEARAFLLETKRSVGTAAAASPRSGAGPVPPPILAAAEQPEPAPQWELVCSEMRMQRKRAVAGAPCENHVRELIESRAAVAAQPARPAEEHAWPRPDAPTKPIMCGGVALSTRGKPRQPPAATAEERSLFDRKARGEAPPPRTDLEHQQFVTLDTASSVKAGEAGHYQMQSLLPLATFKRSALPADAILDAYAQETAAERARPLFDHKRHVEHQPGGELGLVNPAARYDDTWREAKLFDRKAAPPASPHAAQGKLRRSCSFERPTFSSAMREQRLFDRKRAVHAVKLAQEQRSGAAPTRQYSAVAYMDAWAPESAAEPSGGRLDFGGGGAYGGDMEA